MGMRTARVNRSGPGPRYAKLILKRNVTFHGLAWIRRESLDEGVRGGDILLGKNDSLVFTAHAASARATTRQATLKYNSQLPRYLEPIHT